MHSIRGQVLPQYLLSFIGLDRFLSLSVIFHFLNEVVLGVVVKRFLDCREHALCNEQLNVLNVLHDVNLEVELFTRVLPLDLLFYLRFSHFDEFSTRIWFRCLKYVLLLLERTRCAQ